MIALFLFTLLVLLISNSEKYKRSQAQEGTERMQESKNGKGLPKHCLLDIVLLLHL